MNCSIPVSMDVTKDNDTVTKFYTGLPSWDMYMLIFNFAVPLVYIPRSRKSRSKLILQDKLLMVLMRLRLNLLIQYVLQFT